LAGPRQYLIRGGFACKSTNFFPFSKHFVENSSFSACTFQNYPIFALAIPGEIGVDRESAFFALFLDSELAPHKLEKEEEKMFAFAVMFAYVFYLNINSGASP